MALRAQRGSACRSRTTGSTAWPNYRSGPRSAYLFDATSAAAHARHSEFAARAGQAMIDLTPAAIGPYVVPVVNGDAHVDATNVNMVTCGGQATIPIVAAVSSVAKVHYAEIVASISSRSAGPGTRANIDEFTETTARAIEQIGGAARGKAIIILNPAEPPLLMRDTVFTLSSGGDEAAIEAAISAMVARVQAYVPGYRLKQAVQFERFGSTVRSRSPGTGDSQASRRRRSSRSKARRTIYPRMPAISTS